MSEREVKTIDLRDRRRRFFFVPPSEKRWCEGCSDRLAINLTLTARPAALT